MPQFKFKLETVLKHRIAVEDQRQRELAMTLRQRMIFHDQLRQMQQTITSAKRDLASGLVGKVDLDAISSFARYGNQAAYRARSIVMKLATVEKQIDTARQRLLDATKARKAMELLHDRHLALWRKEQDRKATVELDDFANQAVARAMAMEAAE